MKNKKAFGEFISQKRKEASLTQKSFAEKLFVTESAVSKWERGLSYPDITLLRSICEVLGISEHELLTASEDTEARKTESIARRYMRMVEGYKLIVSVMYGCSLLISLICNLVINHTLSWFFIVLTAEMTAFTVTLLPVLVKNKRGIIVLSAFTVSLILLLLTCNIYTHGNWFLITFVSVLYGMILIFLPLILTGINLPEPLCHHKTLICFISDTLMLFLLVFVCNWYVKGNWFFPQGVMILAVSLTVPWGVMLTIRYTRLNRLLKVSLCMGIITAFLFFGDALIKAILGIEPFTLGYRFNFRRWDMEYISENINMIIFLVCMIITIVLSVMGVIKTSKMQSKARGE